MKIATVESLHCDAGWRTFSFLKVTTDDGLVGWSEYTEADGSRGLSAVIQGMAEGLIGLDPRPVQSIELAALRASGAGAQRRQPARHRGDRERVARHQGQGARRARCTSCSAGRCAPGSRCIGRIAARTAVRNHELVGVPPLKNYDDVAALGAEVKARGFKALKTNILPYENGRLVGFGPGFGRTPGHPELNVDRKTLQAVRDTLGAFRSGAGPEMGLHLDVNYHFKTEGFLQVAKAVAPYDMTWLEIDTWDPAVAGSDPASGAVSDRVAGIGDRPARVPAVLRRLRHGCRDHRRDLERLPEVDQDRRDGRGVRSELRAA